MAAGRRTKPGSPLAAATRSTAPSWPPAGPSSRSSAWTRTTRGTDAMVAMEGVDVLLSDGSTVHVRPITADDADRVVALHSRFSPRTRYLRYFSPYPRI